MSITSAKMLAHAVRNTRKQKKLTQHHVAEMVALKQPTISEFENRPDGTRLDTLFKLLAALELELQVVPRDRRSTKNVVWDQEW